MATLNCNGLDDLILSMKEIAEIPQEVQDEILNAQADIVVEEQKRIGRIYGVEKTGITLKSIKKTKPKTKKDGRTIYVYPQGKNKDGNRTAEVAFIANYGKKSQKAKPFITEANERSAEATTQAAMSVYDRWLRTRDL